MSAQHKDAVDAIIDQWAAVEQDPGSLYDVQHFYTVAPFYTASLSTGQLMQRGPPRPRPSSLPRMVMTSMPFLRR